MFGKVKKKRVVKNITLLAAVLVVLLVLFPLSVNLYTRYALSDLPGYQATFKKARISVKDLSYTIEDLKIFKVDGSQHLPFFHATRLKLSIDWSSLLYGCLVGEVRFEKPLLNFISSPASAVSAPSADWSKPVKRLMPLPVNRIMINGGKLAFYDLATNPQVGLFLEQVQLDAQNLSNARGLNERMPSKIYLQARSTGDGVLSMIMKMNTLKDVPDIDMDMKFENVNLRDLQHFFLAYANVSIEHGNFNLYSELAVTDGKIRGYVKPLLKNLRIVDWRLPDLKRFPEKRKIFPESSGEYSILVDGDLNGSGQRFLPSLWNIFRNAVKESVARTGGNSPLVAASENYYYSIADQ